MKKEILYLIEYLSKSEQTDVAQVYCTIVEGLERTLLYAPSRYSRTKVQALMRHSGYTVPQNEDEAVRALDALLETVLPQTLKQNRNTLFHTLLVTNFPTQKSFLEHSLALFESQLEPAQKSIYQTLLTYIVCLNRALGLFYTLGKKSTPESLIDFSQSLHVSLLALIFNEEEKAYLAKGLHELMGVYIGLYGRYLYEEGTC